MLHPDVDALPGLIAQLRAADTGYRVFGSDHHRYRCGPKRSEKELQHFEAAHGIVLPPDYRRYLTVVGDGGVGPFYGLETLEVAAAHRTLSTPFPLTEATTGWTDEQWDRVGDRDDFGGVLEVCHQGCAIYAYLVVAGPTRNTIWHGREDFQPTGISFAAWYRQWLDAKLELLANEALVHRLRIGMSASEVVDAVGGAWRKREALERPVWYFEAHAIPVQLELDEHDVVVKVQPSLFL